MGIWAVERSGMGYLHEGQETQLRSGARPAGQDVRGCASSPVGRHAERSALTRTAPHIMLRDTTATHKFAVGQAAWFSPDRDQEHAKGGLFKIVHLPPKQRACSNTALNV
jgi:hypothetical protein